ncbi:TATA-box-binding protein, putative [Entamoeba invadens IP1]|uniref:TATA-box-binding protein, putative n=1 Tax=Entamoeba invadens IP1 TaxID=370355 RepID=UPI0002C3E9F7|nr:TATA-box-binding protein, putative [Entamoeba invadens IP1]ELP93238.1 TATA-box-binding protein, putative [Entamoeba invadens IP1]|eukprot:XP_004260009.1 TATA-box-binding protein, putative [Entamoeba invadens IP1]
MMGSTTDLRQLSQIGTSIYGDRLSTTTESQDRLNNPNKTHPEIANVVSTFQLNQQLDLRQIVKSAISSLKSTALILKTGKIVCTGTRSIEESKIAAKTIKKIGYNEVRFSNFNVHTIRSCDIKFQISLRPLYDSNTDMCQYEPEVFPVLVFRTTQPKVTLLVFSTGKVVLTGAKDDENLNTAYTKICPILLANKKEEIGNP